MRASVGEWQPLLTGATAARANAAVEAIAEDLMARVKSAPPGLGGHSGYALFFAYLARVSGEERYAQAAAWHHSEAVASVETTTLGLSLFGGLAGVGWMDAHLARVFFEDNTGAEWDGVGDFLLQSVRSGPWRQHYDLIAGLTGYGVYALERLPHPAARECAQAIIARLEEAATETEAGTTWITPIQWLFNDENNEYPPGSCNLGMAHGVPGPIGFLAAAIEARVADDRGRRLLDGAVRWVLAHAVDIGRLSFPSWVRPGMQPKQTRAAWCYGDPGVVSALMRAAQATGNEAYVSAAVEIGTRASMVRFEDTGVKDAGLCHGAAGLAHIYQRLFSASGHPAFEQAARDWLEYLLEMRRPGEGIGGFILFGPRRDAAPPEPSTRRERPEAVWQPDPTFLTGSAGIGLTLLAATSSVAPEWDRLLLLS